MKKKQQRRRRSKPKVNVGVFLGAFFHQKGGGVGALSFHTYILTNLPCFRKYVIEFIMIRANFDDLQRACKGNERPKPGRNNKKLMRLLGDIFNQVYAREQKIIHKQAYVSPHVRIKVIFSHFIWLISLKERQTSSQRPCRETLP